jgi:HK97 gp10 family phage protein
MIDFVMTGHKEIVAALRELSAKMEKKVLSQALRDATKIYADAIKQEAPVLSGKLRRSVKVRAMKRKRGRVGYSARFNQTDGGKWYANTIEYGSKHAGRSRAIIPANPFMRRAFDRISPRLKNELPSIIAKRLEDLANKLGHH